MSETSKPKIEGEGSYEATHRYNSAVERHAKEGDVDGLAKKAAEALDGPEGDELRKAEAEGRRGPHPEEHRAADAKEPQARGR
jgi:hypothetical protein